MNLVLTAHERRKKDRNFNLLLDYDSLVVLV